MTNKKAFLVRVVLILVAAMFGTTLIFTTFQQEMHKTFMLEIINMKIRK